MVKILYERVDNKVILSDYESDFTHIENGVKQGCALSPTLFNLFITDLEKIVTGIGGVKVESVHVNGLYYADNIVRFAEHEQNLNGMLDITDKFARKWGLKVNDNKQPQVIVVGNKCSD